MFKTFFAVLAAACLVAMILTSLGLASILGPGGIALWAVGLVLIALLVLYGRRAAATFLTFLAVGVALSGCAGMGAIAGFNNALAPNFKPLAISIDQGMTCSDLADRMAGADSNQLTSPQLRTMYRACEEMQRGYALQLDPQAARKAIDGAIKAASSPGAVVTKAAGLP